MSDKVERKNIKTTIYIHKIYCDNCGKFLTEDDETEDGWYPNQFKREIYYSIKGDRYTLIEDLCDECYNVLLTTIKESLESLGFRKEE